MRRVIESEKDGPDLVRRGLFAGGAALVLGSLFADDIRAFLRSSAEKEHDGIAKALIDGFVRTEGFTVDFSSFNPVENFICEISNPQVATSESPRNPESRAFYSAALPREKQIAALEGLKTVVEMYPPSFIKNVSALEKVRVIDDLYQFYFQKDSCDKEKNVAGVFRPDYPQEIVMEISTSEKDNKMVFVHELHHQIEMRLGVLIKEDPLWPVSDFRKANPHALFKDFPRAVQSGYFTRYSMNDPADDRAEIAQLLFCDPVILEMRIFVADAEGGTILKAKLRAIKQMYFDWSNGALDEQFWEDVYWGKKIDASYWARRQLRKSCSGIGPQTLDCAAVANQR